MSQLYIHYKSDFNEYGYRFPSTFILCISLLVSGPGKVYSAWRVTHLQRDCVQNISSQGKSPNAILEYYLWQCGFKLAPLMLCHHLRLLASWGLGVISSMAGPPVFLTSPQARRRPCAGTASGTGHLRDRTQARSGTCYSGHLWDGAPGDSKLCSGPWSPAVDNDLAESDTDTKKPRRAGDGVRSKQRHRHLATWKLRMHAGSSELFSAHSLATPPNQERCCTCPPGERLQPGPERRIRTRGPRMPPTRAGKPRGQSSPLSFKNQNLGAGPWLSG